LKFSNSLDIKDICAKYEVGTLSAVVIIHSLVGRAVMTSVSNTSPINLNYDAANDGALDLTQHAEMRMSQRSIDLEQIQLVLSYGRLIHSRRARFYVMGRKEIKRLEKNGLEVSDLENIQIVVAKKSNLILTVYRNKDFRQIRPKHRRERRMQ
jgi:hypothetical protein